MDEEDVISEPVENLPQYDVFDPSGMGEDRTPPKNPSETEAILIILGLGVVPDVIDFFSIGGLSFLSSALSWPVTEYYFYQKNLKVPNIRKWIRGTNLGDVIPFLGVLPLKTIGLLAGIYIAWHPESKLSKSAQAINAITSPQEAAKENSAWINLKQKVKKMRATTEEKSMSMEEFAYKKESPEKDIYEEIREGAGGIMGPEEQAERETFGEVISDPERQAEEQEATAPSQPVRERPTEQKSEPKPLSEISTPRAAKGEKEREEEIESRLGIGEVEREIKEKLTSPEAVMENQGIPTFNGGRGVDLRGQGDK